MLTGNVCLGKQRPGWSPNNNITHKCISMNTIAAYHSSGIEEWSDGILGLSLGTNSNKSLVHQLYSFKSIQNTNMMFNLTGNSGKLVIG